MAPSRKFQGSQGKSEENTRTVVVGEAESAAAGVLQELGLQGGVSVG